MREKSVVGDIINFRGLVYSPTNENGVIFLFGKVMEDINMYIEEIKPGFPDCIGRRFTGKGWERVYIEFEYKSSHFQEHRHNPDDCDLIVCWEHDWPDSPLEVIELREIIKSLPNKPIQRPDTITDTSGIDIEVHFKNFPKKIKELFQLFDNVVKGMSDEIWHKVTERPGVTYYSPERVFIYLRFQKQGLRLTLFTRGEKLEGVKSFEYERGGAKWGRLHIRDEKQLEKAIPVLKRSYELIKDAIKNNEATGWYAGIEEDTEEEGDESTYTPEEST
ncbi:MAG: hypothetical protein OEW70_04830 [candidate division WOR-3 bacterium]|nr:hypothetical protein [candidate division WOR-3 bacterium]